MQRNRRKICYHRPTPPPPKASSSLNVSLTHIHDTLKEQQWRKKKFKTASSIWVKMKQANKKWNKRKKRTQFLNFLDEQNKLQIQSGFIFCFHYSSWFFFIAFSFWLCVRVLCVFSFLFFLLLALPAQKRKRKTKSCLSVSFVCVSAIKMTVSQHNRNGKAKKTALKQ